MMMALIDQLRAQGIRDERVLAIMARVPRDAFVAVEDRDNAYKNIPLPIGHAQTISQPYVVARMTEALCRGPLERVLEVGTGSGYQAAILAQCANEVYTIERIKPLYLHAQNILQRLHIDNVHVYYGDGGEGLPEHAPYDGIMVTAAMASVPETLLSQLAVGGRLVAPMGSSMGGITSQVLRVYTRTAHGLLKDDLDSVRFVPFKKGVE